MWREGALLSLAGVTPAALPWAASPSRPGRALLGLRHREAIKSCHYTFDLEGYTYQRCQT